MHLLTLVTSLGLIPQDPSEANILSEDAAPKAGKTSQALAGLLVAINL